METRAAWFILGILIGALLLLPIVLAQDDSESWAQDERRLNVQQTADGFRYESTRESDLGNDVVEGSFSTLNRRYSVSYLDRSSTNMTPLRLIVAFEGLLEYQDVDGDNAYSLGDRIIQRQRLVDLPAPAQRIDPLLNGGQRATYTYSLADLDPESKDATLEVIFSMFPRAQMIGGQLVPPTRPHTEVTVDHFPFQNESSRLALETRVYANGPLEETPNAFYVSAEERRLVYEWPGQSTVDGDVRPVHVTLLGTGGQSTNPAATPAVVLLSYERGDALSYQPVIGPEREEPKEQNAIVEFFTHGDWRLYGIGVVAAFALIGATMWRRIERA
ncbi:MAG TPA: hypothetical protein VGB18_04310 [Candidatus Thermoplasmatota archaeon]